MISKTSFLYLSQLRSICLKTTLGYFSCLKTRFSRRLKQLTNQIDLNYYYTLILPCQLDFLWQFLTRNVKLHVNYKQILPGQERLFTTIFAISLSIYTQVSLKHLKERIVLSRIYLPKVCTIPRVILLKSSRTFPCSLRVAILKMWLT